MGRGVHECLVQSVGGTNTLASIGENNLAEGEHLDQPRQAARCAFGRNRFAKQPVGTCTVTGALSEKSAHSQQTPVCLMWQSLARASELSVPSRPWINAGSRVSGGTSVASTVSNGISTACCFARNRLMRIAWQSSLSRRRLKDVVARSRGSDVEQLLLFGLIHHFLGSRA
jgi:hypothetical protein